MFFGFSPNGSPPPGKPSPPPGGHRTCKIHPKKGQRNWPLRADPVADDQGGSRLTPKDAGAEYWAAEGMEPSLDGRDQRPGQLHASRRRPDPAERDPSPEPAPPLRMKILNRSDRNRSKRPRSLFHWYFFTAGCRRPGRCCSGWYKNRRPCGGPNGVRRPPRDDAGHASGRHQTCEPVPQLQAAPPLLAWLRAYGNGSARM